MLDIFVLHAYTLPPAPIPFLFYYFSHAEAGDDSKVEEVLEAGADISVKDPSGRTPLDIAKTSENKKDMIIELLEKKMASS